MYSTLRSSARVCLLWASFLSVAIHVAAAPTGATDCNANPDFGDSAPVAVTTDGSPGIGVEFETNAILLENEKCNERFTFASKGQPISQHQGNEWDLTGDTTSKRGGLLTTEYIINGKKVKLNTGQAGVAAEDMANDLDSWAPEKGKQVEIITTGIDDQDIRDNYNCNPWTVSQPAQWTGSTKIYFSRQVTAPMPLAAMNELIGIGTQRTRRDHPLLPTGPFGNAANLVHVTSDYFQSLPGVQVSDDAMGFLSLVLSYAKHPGKFGEGDSPKVLTSLMPRTTFVAMYRMVESSLQGAMDQAGGLLPLLEVLACYELYDGDLIIDHHFCSGMENNPTVKPDALGGGVFNIGSGSKIQHVKVKDWIEQVDSHTGDLLAQADQVIDGQVGGYGAATEWLLDHPNVRVPLFEFRDLGSSTPANFRKDVEAAEAAIVALHRKHAPAARRQARREAFFKRGMDPDVVFAACPMWEYPPASGSGANSTDPDVEARFARFAPARIPVSSH